MSVRAVDVNHASNRFNQELNGFLFKEKFTASEEQHLKVSKKNFTMSLIFSD